MLVYVASTFDLVPHVERVVDYLKSRGHHIAVEWWGKDGFDLRDQKADRENPEAFYQNEVCGLIFERDFRGVRDCDALVLVCGDAPRAFNGANVEYGLALAFGKPCFSIGALDNSAMYHPMVKCRSLDELGAALEGL